MLTIGALALATRPVKAVRPMLATPVLFKLFTRTPFVIVVSVVVRRRIMITRWARKVIVETAILAVRVAVMIVKMMIANMVVLMHVRIVFIRRTREIFMRIVGMLMRSREFVVYMVAPMIHELFVTVEVVWIFVFMFALVLRNGEWVGVGVGIRIRKRQSRRSS